MDEKTVIARPKAALTPEDAKLPPQTAKSDSQDSASLDTPAAGSGDTDGKTVIVARRESKPAAPEANSSRMKQTTAKAVQPKGAKGTSGGYAPVIALLVVAVLLVGFGSALVSIYIFTPGMPTGESTVAANNTAEISDADLNKDIVPVETPESAAEDEALILAAIKPHIIELSGDPVIVRQLSNAPRQLVKLAKATQVEAATGLGIKSDVYLLKDLLDVPDGGLQSGVFGSQEDIAVVQSDQENTVADDQSVIVANGADSVGRINDYAKIVQVDTPLATYLTSIGMDPGYAKQAEASFIKLHNRQSVQIGDQIAVRAISSQDGENRLIPVQISIYSVDGYVGSVAVNDIDAYADAADPWYGTDIFEAELLPVEVKDEDRPRLLDAIYAAAVRNRLPTPVVGEAIMMLSRTQDLEQKLQAGDTITIIYSPQARDLKSGLGRIIFISIGRTSGNLDCYVMQAGQGEQFDCVAAVGKETIDQPGMVAPVKGTIVAKFGSPVVSADGSADPQSSTNIGIDWTAEKGSPVVAAYAGEVSAVGREEKFGLVVRLSHMDGKTSMYGYLDHVPPGLAVGAKVAAGQTIGFIGTPAASREPRLHFELANNGVPVDPVTEMQPAPGVVVGAIEQFVGRIIHIESANRCDARNPLSTAVGLGQFIESTWMVTIKIHRPDLYGKLSRRQILDLRTDCTLARAMTTAFTRDNAAVIRQAGHGVTPGNLYLAHFLGVGGALKVLSNNPNRQIAEVFGASHVKANPFERGKTIGYLVSWAAKKMSGSSPPPSADKSGPKAVAVAAAPPSAAPAATADKTKGMADTSPAPAPLTQMAANPQFEQLKSAVNLLLQP